MNNVLHDTPPRKLHQTLTMIYPLSILFYPWPNTTAIRKDLTVDISFVKLRLNNKLPTTIRQEKI